MRSGFMAGISDGKRIGRVSELISLSVRTDELFMIDQQSMLAMLWINVVKRSVNALSEAFTQAVQSLGL